MMKEKVNGINKNNRILLQRLIAISNRRRTSERSVALKRTSRITTLFGNSLSKRFHNQSPEMTPEKHFSEKRQSENEGQPIVEEDQQLIKDNESKLNASSNLGNSRYYSRVNKINDELRFRKSKPAQTYLRDQVITSKFNKRFNDIKKIEQENFKLAQRLYNNKP